MFVAGQSIYAGVVFSVLSMLVAVPSAVKVFNWTATLYKGSISWDTPMLYALGFIGLFTIGGLTGVMLATLGIDVHVHDTYFIVAHFHYIMVGGAIMGYLGGLHYWWPKITGRMYPVFWSKLSALAIFIGFNVTFFPQFILGYLGMPRRYHTYPPEFQVLNVMSSAGATILGIGYLLPLVYFVWSMRYGPRATANPWGADGPRVADDVAAADRELRAPARRDGAAVHVRRAARRPERRPPVSHDAHGPPGLAHHFDTYEQQKESATLGMWTFLVTEILFFGGLFAAYSLYRSLYPEAFRAASHTLDIRLGAFNTAVLIGSSLTMALAVRGGQTGKPKVDVRDAPRHARPRLDVPRREGVRVPPQVRRAPRARARPSTSRAPRRARTRSSSSASTSR